MYIASKYEHVMLRDQHNIYCCKLFLFPKCYDVLYVVCFRHFKS